ncbi:unnamed protein product [Phaeothamnion confervicola]
MEKRILPRRLNPTRAWVVACYALPLCVVWALSMVMPWWAWLLVTAALVVVYSQVLLPRCEARRHSAVEAAMVAAPGQGQGADEPQLDALTDVVTAPERWLALWVGCVLSFVVYFAVAGAALASSSNRGSASADSSGDGSVGGGIGGGNDFAAEPLRHAPGVAWLAVVLLVLTLALWLGLVWLRPDPGILRGSPADFAFLRGHVARAGGPPDPKAVCATCLVHKPLRSKHCAQCGVCVARMDHHCIWLNNCVGRHNHALFVCFVAAHLFMCIVFIGLAALVWVDGVEGNAACAVLGSLLSTRFFPTLLLGLAAMLGSGMLLLILTEQLRNAAVNFTTNERINRRRYPWLRAPGPGPGQGQPFNHYDRGWKTNCAEFWRGGHAAHGGCGGGTDVDYYASYDLPRLTRNQENWLDDLRQRAAPARGGRGGARRGGHDGGGGRGRFGDRLGRDGRGTSGGNSGNDGNIDSGGGQSAAAAAHPHSG